MDSEIETCKKLESDNIDSSGLNSKIYGTHIENVGDELPVREVVYLQQSKRSRYFSSRYKRVLNTNTQEQMT